MSAPHPAVLASGRRPRQEKPKPTSLTRLAAAPPSGRSRPLLLDTDDYAVRVVRQGAPVPWLDLAQLTGFVGQVTSLLRLDAVWVDLADLYEAHMAARPDLRDAMAARRRTGYALRTLLGDDEIGQSVVATLTTIGQSTGRALVLDVPSPGRWVGLAHTAAGTPLDEVDEDAADSGSMYLAELLGRLGGVPVALLLLDADPRPGETGISAERLADYTSVVNVARHYDWSVGMLADGQVELSEAADPHVACLPENFWDAGEPPTEGPVMLSRIPTEANPERVLTQLERLHRTP